MSPLGFLTSFVLVVSVSASCCSPEKYTSNVRITSSANGTFFESNGVQYADPVNGLYVIHANYKDLKGVSSIAKTHFNILSGDSYTVVGGHCTKVHIEMPDIKMFYSNCIPEKRSKTIKSDGSIEVGAIIERR